MKNEELSKSLSERLRGAYWSILRDIDSLRLKQWEQSQLTLPQLRVLFYVGCNPGITTGGLARDLRVTVSTASGLIAKLVDRDLVARGSSQDDRRQIPLELTDEGHALACELSEITRPFMDGLARELGDELEAAVAALETINIAAKKLRET